MLRYATAPARLVGASLGGRAVGDEFGGIVTAVRKRQYGVQLTPTSAMSMLTTPLLNRLRISASVDSWVCSDVLLAKGATTPYFLVDRGGCGVRQEQEMHPSSRGRLRQDLTQHRRKRHRLRPQLTSALKGYASHRARCASHAPNEAVVGLTELAGKAYERLQPGRLPGEDGDRHAAAVNGIPPPPAP